LLKPEPGGFGAFGSIDISKEDYENYTFHHDEGPSEDYENLNTDNPYMNMPFGKQ
jgi:hypothetical protein